MLKVSRVCAGFVIFGAIALGACAQPAEEPEEEAVAVSTQELGGVSVGTLRAAGWTCFRAPLAPRIVCAPPGLGIPTVPADPDRSPTRQFLAFSVETGALIGTVHMIRQDLYAGEPCAGGDPYVLRGPIGYYECFNPR